MGRIFYGYWTCKYCDNEHRGDINTCPNCGHPRSSDVKFHPNPHNQYSDRQYVQDYHNSGPNWRCSYCDSMISAEKSVCPGCGHSRDQSDKDYFCLHPERSSIIPKGCDSDD